MKKEKSIFFDKQLISIRYILGILCIVSFYSCSNCGCDKDKINKYNKSHPLITKVNGKYGDTTEVRLYVIDNCEYIGKVDNYHNDFLAHKGDCKFCKARASKIDSLKSNTYEIDSVEHVKHKWLKIIIKH
jgi:hypothetical protein